VLVEKEVISPGSYFYIDEKTGLPRKWTVTAETTKHLHDQGNSMIALGLPVPVPFEHDYQAHPMTPKEKLLGNAGEVKEYRMKGDALWSIVDVQDEEAKKKVGKSIRWTSPWISSFTDGSGRQWNNVIAHLALTTRPRVTKQAPFQSISAALSLATENKVDVAVAGVAEGFCVSRAGRLVERDNKLRPQYPMAFSMYSGGIKLSDDDFPPKKEKKDDLKKDKKSGAGEGGEGGEGGGLDDGKGGEDSESEMDIGGLMNPMQDSTGDVKMEELLCDLLSALGVQMPENVGESEFKRALYEATMSKVKELSAKGQASGPANAQNAAGNTHSPAGQTNNPLIHQEQQPMFMSLEDIQKIADPTMKGIALSMYNENVKLRAEVDSSTKTANGLRDAKLKEATALRASRVVLLGKVSPRVKGDLDAMLALPSMALSMGDGGVVVDPMAQTLAVLEKGLADMPRLLTTPSDQVIAMSQPTDSDMLTDERADEIADKMARMMGAPPEQKKAS
jgi:hypothetical protein